MGANVGHRGARPPGCGALRATQEAICFLYGNEFLRLAARHRLQVTTTSYPIELADQALRDLAHDRVNGARGPRHPSPPLTEPSPEAKKGAE